MGSITGSQKFKEVVKLVSGPVTSPIQGDLQEDCQSRDKKKRNITLILHKSAKGKSRKTGALFAQLAE